MTFVSNFGIGRGLYSLTGLVLQFGQTVLMPSVANLEFSLVAENTLTFTLP